MSPMQQIFLGLGAVATKTYVDDVFSTYVYAGNSTARSINNGLDLSGEGGMVWIKSRDNAYDHYIVDTERGALNRIRSNSNGGSGSAAQTLTAFNNNGFALGADSINLVVNASNKTYSSWSFRKAPGFFDVVTWTGNGSNRTIAHSLGSVPGIIMVKCTSMQAYWWVYHRDIGATKVLYLNDSSAAATNSAIWNDTEPTSTNFSLGTGEGVNKNGETYVAYVFAGGESTTDKAVDFDGSGDYLSLPSTTDLNLTGDFTIEFWVYPRSQSTSRQTILQTNRSFGAKYAVLQIQNDTQSGLSKKAQLWDYDMNNGYAIAYSNADIEEDEWTHIAFTRESGTIKIWINGKLDKTTTGLSDSIEFGDTSSFIGNHSNNYYLNAKLSNLRIVKGQALYTTNFNVPSDPLTQTSQNAVSSNVKLLCCNGATAAASTVTPVTITANGDPTVTTNNSLFDDTAAHVFGESGSENVIKCGSYTTDSNEDATVNLGFEPQWVLAKRTDSTGDWRLYDSMRGLLNAQDIAANNSGSKYLEANDNAAETNSSKIGLTSTGFYADQDGANRTYIYVALRRPDGYCGRPPELGTDVFAMDTGSSSSTIPTFDSGFPVDFGLARQFASNDSWLTSSRLIGGKYLKTNSSDAESSNTHLVWDSNKGFWKELQNTYQSWMWKRHAGFDVVTYKGDDIVGRQISHNLSKIPEMIWIKNRDNSASNAHWRVYHKGLNGGTNPADKYLILNTTDAEQDSAAYFNDTEPTSTAFTVGSHISVNEDGSNLIAMLFASVNGISKVGSYEGSNSPITITTGFQPRFFFVKRYDYTGNWTVFDTLRGWGSGGDCKFEFNTDGAQNCNTDFGYPTSTGIYLTNDPDTNLSGRKFIYYAHA